MEALGCTLPPKCLSQGVVRSTRLHRDGVENFSAKLKALPLVGLRSDTVFSRVGLCSTRTHKDRLSSIKSTIVAASGVVILSKAKIKVGEDLPPDYDKQYPPQPVRRAGILLHPTSLPGPYGIGDLGEDARQFLDWVKGTGCTIWQVLPLVPPGRKSGEDGSPYAGSNANCGNTLLISLEELVKDGLLEESDLPSPVPVENVDYEAVAARKDPLILKAAQKLLLDGGPLKKEMEAFRKDPKISVWLEDAALFAAIDGSLDFEFWWQWPEALRDRDGSALKKAKQQHKQYIDEFVAQQFIFQRQWQAIHKYANSLGIKVIGDMPIYVGGHSADVWANRKFFMVDPKTGVPTAVSGVPPDAFSATGQLWGSPLYNWQAMSKDKYSWWAMRMRRAFELYDEFRIDHFRGLAGYWAIGAEEETAMNGTWKMGPGEEFFVAIKKAVGKVDIIAEDLGVITADVVALRQAIQAPGMSVLLFAWGGGSKNPHLPHNHEANQVVYPGTHDNDTVMGWWEKASENDKKLVRKYLQLTETSDVSFAFIRAAVASVAQTAIFSMQDILGLDNSARMNTPAVQAGNWAWRVGPSGFFDNQKETQERLKELLKDHNRLG
eukprot:TRINITY_DN23053_c0_g1_i1.p1 TRINITY_DN23053_c0_g1~~TRINITY_DN23053_c0_g1_i1.p1  ORF type:complete len:615 (+),score=133.21 TRINITY_DN23053_c0_g1_i1:30-1847(+)